MGMFGPMGMSSKRIPSFVQKLMSGPRYSSPRGINRFAEVAGIGGQLPTQQPAEAPQARGMGLREIAQNMQPGPHLREQLSANRPQVRQSQAFTSPQAFTPQNYNENAYREEPAWLQSHYNQNQYGFNQFSSSRPSSGTSQQQSPMDSLLYSGRRPFDWFGMN